MMMKFFFSLKTKMILTLQKIVDLVKYDFKNSKHQYITEFYFFALFIMTVLILIVLSTYYGYGMAPFLATIDIDPFLIEPVLPKFFVDPNPFDSLETYFNYIYEMEKFWTMFHNLLQTILELLKNNPEVRPAFREAFENDSRFSELMHKLDELQKLQEQNQQSYWKIACYVTLGLVAITAITYFLGPRLIQPFLNRPPGNSSPPTDASNVPNKINVELTSSTAKDVINRLEEGIKRVQESGSETKLNEILDDLSTHHEMIRDIDKGIFKVHLDLVDVHDVLIESTDTLSQNVQTLNENVVGMGDSLSQNVHVLNDNIVNMGEKTFETIAAQVGLSKRASVKIYKAITESQNVISERIADVSQNVNGLGETIESVNNQTTTLVNAVETLVKENIHHTETLTTMITESNQMLAQILQILSGS